MKTPVEMTMTVLARSDELSLAATFDCGQCFRWNPDGRGGYTGVAMGRAAHVREESGHILISGGESDAAQIWRGYFDLELDYAEIRSAICVNDHMVRAADFGAGIRILRQNKWEALCSFIISQCNNIPRIKQIIEKLCGLYGEPIEFEGGIYHAFPEPELIAGLSESDLTPLRSGYRAKYILEAARLVSSGDIDLDALSDSPPDEAMSALLRLPGVGKKVAGCAMLFGLHMLDSFPIDTWMKKALAKYYGEGFDPSVFSPYAGIAQQYMFYYERSGGNSC
jgi:N-glycosylase/DNA lyase